MNSRDSILKYLTCLFLTFLLFQFTGCKALRSLAEVQKPSLSVQDVHVTDFAFDEIELTFDVAVDNPNPIDLRLLSYGYDFNINGNTFVQGTRENGLMIEAGGQSIIQIPVRLNFQQLYDLFSSLRGEDDAHYKLLADLSFDLPVIGKTVLPLKKEGEIPLIKLPKISVRGLEVKSMGISELDLALHLKMKNPNAFGLILNALSYNLKVNGETWAKSIFAGQMKATKNGSTSISIPVSINPLKIGTSVVKLLNSSNDLRYSLKGSIDVGTTHPLLDETIFNFFESGELPVITQ